MPLDLKPMTALALWRAVTLEGVRSDAPDLTQRQFAILLHVYLVPPPHTVRGLAQTLKVTKPAITRALDTLGRLQLLKRRRDTGLIVPGPIQAAAVAALNDDAHVVAAQRTYERRRALLTQGLQAAGFRVNESGAGLFVWATIGESDQATAQQFADLGVLVAPGGFYGPSGRKHVRMSLTVPDQALEEVILRLQP